MNRKEEVRHLLSLSVEELIAESRGQLKVVDSLEELYEYLAEEMVAEFRKAAAGEKIVNFIMPVGPTQPYRIMAEKINREGVSLKNVRFFFMDEYVEDDRDELIPMTHPLSFRGQIGPLFFNRLRPDLRMPEEQAFREILRAVGRLCQHARVPERFDHPDIVEFDLGRRSAELIQDYAGNFDAALPQVFQRKKCVIDGTESGGSGKKDLESEKTYQFRGQDPVGERNADSSRAFHPAPQELHQRPLHGRRFRQPLQSRLAMNTPPL